MADVRKAKLIDDGGEMPTAAKPRKARRLALVVIASVACGVMLGSAVTAAVGTVLYYGRQVITKPATPKFPERTREELRELVVGKDQDFVMKTLGKPSSTSGIGGFATWYYNYPCYDSVNKKADGFVPIQFQNGVAVQIRF